MATPCSLGFLIVFRRLYQAYLSWRSQSCIVSDFISCSDPVFYTNNIDDCALRAFGIKKPSCTCEAAYGKAAGRMRCAAVPMRLVGCWWWLCWLRPSWRKRRRKIFPNGIEICYAVVIMMSVSICDCEYFVTQASVYQSHSFALYLNILSPKRDWPASWLQ